MPLHAKPWLTIYQAYAAANRGVLDPAAAIASWAPGERLLHLALQGGEVAALGRVSVTSRYTTISPADWINQMHRPAGCFEVVIERGALGGWLEKFRPKPNADYFDWPQVREIFLSEVEPFIGGQNQRIAAMCDIYSRRFKGRVPSPAQMRRKLIEWETGEKAPR